MKETILNLSGTARKYHVFAVIDSFFTCLWVSAIMGVLFFILMHFEPYKLVPWVIFIGGLLSLFFVVAIFMYLSSYIAGQLDIL